MASRRALRRVGELLMTAGERLIDLAESDRLVMHRLPYLEQRHVVMEAVDRGDHIEVVGCGGRVLRFTR